MSETAESENLRPVDFKFLECKRIILSYAPAMSNTTIELLPAIYQKLIKDVSYQIILVRPKRHYPRPNDEKPRNKGKGIYARPAKLSSKDKKASCFHLVPLGVALGWYV
jgi:hypothetical protein